MRQFDFHTGCLVKGCMDMGQEGAEGTDCPAEKYTACDGCMTTRAILTYGLGERRGRGES